VTHPATKTAPKQALVVVVDRPTRKACYEAFSSAGFAVANGTDSGTAAVTMAREQHPDIIVLSDQLSDVPASEAVKWLRSNKQLATTPIIVVGGPAAKNQQSNDDAFYALPRPVTAAAIKALVSTLVNKPRDVG